MVNPTPRSPSPQRLAACLAACAAYLLACSSCSSGGGSQPDPELRLLCPGVATTDEATSRIRGSSNQPLAEVLVGNRLAESSDGFLHWHLDVPLAAGVNRIRISGRAADGRRAETVYVDRFVPRFLVPRAVAIAAAPASNRLLAITPAPAPANDPFWGPGLGTHQIDLRDGILADQPLPNDEFDSTPEVSRVAGSDDGTRIDAVLQGTRLRTIQEAHETAVQQTFPGGITQRSTAEVRELHARAATGRPDEFAAVWDAGLGTVDGDGRNRDLWIATSPTFQPGALTRGPDDSTFFVAHATEPLLWQCLRDDPTPRAISSATVGLGPPTGRIRSLCYVAAVHTLFALGTEGLFRIHPASGNRALIDPAPDATLLVAAGDDAFLLDSGGRIDRLRPTGDVGAEREPLQTRRIPNQVDWNSVLAIDFDAGVRQQRVDDVGDPANAPPPPLLRRIAFVDSVGSGWFDMDTGQAHRAAVLPDPEGPAAINAIDLGVTHMDRVTQPFPQLVVRDRVGNTVSSLALSGELVGVTYDETDDRVVTVELLPDGAGYWATTRAPAFPTIDARLAKWALAAPPSSIQAANGRVWSARDGGRDHLAPDDAFSTIDFESGVSRELPRPAASRFQQRTLFYDHTDSTLGLVIHGGVFVQDPASGNWRRVSGDGLGRGPEILDPGVACAIEEEDAVAFVDRGWGGLMHVDLLTGERTLLDW